MFHPDDPAKYGFENPFREDPLAVRALSFARKGGELLDIGCGEGADSVFYAENGFRVDAVDNDLISLSRLRAFLEDNPQLAVTIFEYDVVSRAYPITYYDMVNCLLVGCCMKRSEFEIMLVSLKQTLKPGGLVVMSLRNYLDPMFLELGLTEKMIEPNTFRKKEDCCEIRYFIEKGRLRKVFHDFEVLYYFEGLTPDKYGINSAHGDSYIIARKPDLIA